MFRTLVTRGAPLLNLHSRRSIPRLFFSSPATSSAAAEDLDLLRARLLYQSKKRGILENDLLIGVFGERYLPKMNLEELQSYDKLINGDIMEWDLFYYISGKKDPPAEVANASAFILLKNFVQQREFADKPKSKTKVQFLWKNVWWKRCSSVGSTKRGKKQAGREHQKLLFPISE
ncbi:unnamed protein product [Cylicocyclus nassatus]|uniref:Succinate dehydrogenase assembly factor 2, mitochondrial n=1 Tax=Cylicocyclus nassatus TaxID=53992 RepID=A0AA36DQZ2_CYLNA|nr:unnamed protein product [Cylicocyclus nassatus]